LFTFPFLYACPAPPRGGPLGRANALKLGQNAIHEGSLPRTSHPRRAIEELAALVGYVVNNLNGHHIVVTADHGFLFAETAPGETEKSKLDERPAGTVLPDAARNAGLDNSWLVDAWGQAFKLVRSEQKLDNRSGQPQFDFGRRVRA
jgi:hypothetical protein